MKYWLLSEIMFGAISLGAFWVAREFWIAKDGILRKLMIAYFAIEIFVYVSSGIYFYLAAHHKLLISIIQFVIIVLLPKFFMKLRLVYYLKTKR